MSDDTTTAPPADATTTTDGDNANGTSGGERQQTVPVAVLQKERTARQELEAELAKLREAEAERAKAEMSEVERYKTEAEEAKALAEKLQGDIVTRDKQSWIRDAAAKHGFIDAEDAVAQIAISGLDDERAANEAVKALKAKKPHLIGQRNSEPTLKKVLDQGERTTDAAQNGHDRPPKYTMEQLRSITPEQAKADLEEVNRALTYWSTHQQQ